MVKFKIGDTVRLKSGGPMMTIEAVYTSENVGISVMVYSQLKTKYPGAEEFYSCKWFDDKRKLEQSIFVEEAIELEE